MGAFPFLRDFLAGNNGELGQEDGVMTSIGLDFTVEAKDVQFRRLKRMLWVLFQSIVLRSSCIQVEELSNKD